MRAPSRGGEPVANIAGEIVFARAHQHDFKALLAKSGDLSTAAEAAWQARDADGLHELWRALDDWLTATGQWTWLAALLDRVVALDREAAKSDQLSAALAARAGLRSEMGEAHEALADADEAVSLARTGADAKTLGDALMQQAAIVDETTNGGPRLAMEMEQEALRCYELANEPAEQAYAIYRIAGASSGPDSERGLLRALTLVSSIRPSTFLARRYRGYILTALGIRRIQTKKRDGFRLLEEGLRVKREMGDMRAIAHSLKLMAQVEVEAGHESSAVALLREADGILSRLGADPARSRCLSSLARALAACRAFQEALETAEQALELVSPEAEPGFYGVVLHDRADVLRAQGQLGEAIDAYRSAAEHKARGDNRADEVVTLLALAAAEDEAGHRAEAVAVARGALAKLRDNGVERATTWHSAGRLLESLGERAEALSAYGRVLELVSPEAEPGFYGVVLHDRADVLRAQGQLGEAIDAYRSAAEHKARGDNRADEVVTLLALAAAEDEAGHRAEAVAVARGALAKLRDNGVERATPGEVYAALDTLIELGEFATAVTLGRETLPGLRRRYGSDEAEVLVIASALSYALDQTAQFRSARRLSADVFRETRGRADGSGIRIALLPEGEAIARNLSHVPGAREFAEAIAAARIRAYPATHSIVYSGNATQAIVRLDTCDYRGALDIARPLARSCQRAMGRSVAETLSAYDLLSLVLFRMADYRAAVRIDEANAHIRSRLLGRFAIPALVSKAGVASCLFALGRYRRAIAIEEEVLQDLRTHAPSGEDLIWVGGNLAIALSETGQRERSEELAVELLDLARSSYGPLSTVATDAAVTVGQVMTETRPELSAGLLRQALDTSARRYGTQHHETYRVGVALAYAMLKLGQYDDAAHLASRVSAGASKLIGPDHPDTLRCRVLVALAARERGRIAQFEDVAADALTRMSTVLGIRHPRYVEAKAQLRSAHSLRT